MQFWLKNLYLSKRYGGRTPLSEFADYGWKLESIDSLLKRIRKKHAAVDRVRRVAVEDLVLGQEYIAKKAAISSWDFV